MEMQSPQASAASIALFYSKSMVRGRLKFLHLKDVHASTSSFRSLPPFSLKAGTLSACNTRAFVNATDSSSGLGILFGARFGESLEDQIMAMILTAFIPQVIQVLDGITKREEILLLGVADEVKGLVRRLEELRNILQDAERRSYNEKEIQWWLTKLRDIIYDIDDMIDQCKIEGESHKRLLEQQAQSFRLRISTKCSVSLFSFFNRSFHHEITERIKRLSSRLDQVIKEAAKFQLISSIHGYEVSLTNKCIVRAMDPESVEFKFKKDAESMFKLLTMEERMNLLVITGVGGIGKTRLAQKIYYDERTKAHFQVRIWICVTQQTTFIDMLKQIITGAGQTYGEAQTSEQLEIELKRVLEHKKFLLVLDDVWSIQICNDLLQRSSQNIVSGSRVLITTRNETLARELPGAHLHRMKPLSTKEGWSMLRKELYQEDHVQEMQELNNIGIKIVRKCKGFPLAIRVIAGVLRTRGWSSEEWEKVFLDPAWSSFDLPNDVTRALYLAYKDLPANLRQCLVYCSLFPEDHLFDQQSITKYWIAERLVEEKERSTIEDTAEGYYKELIWRNLLERDFGQQDAHKMHGLLRFLAHFLAGEENLFGNLDLMDATSTKPRRLSIVAKGLMAIPTELKEQNSLRTLLLFRNPLSGKILDDFLQGLNHLRVLDIHGTDVDSLPDCIGDLIHLRHLNVSSTRLKQLPDSIERLINLQFLSVRGCESMTALPQHLVKLQSIRSLDLVGTQVNWLPVGVGKLENLNSLLGFLVDSGSEGILMSTLDDLGPLTMLKYLLLQKLERVSNGAESARANLRRKKYLKNLSMHWSLNIADAQLLEVDKFKEVLEALCPSSSLEELEIMGYPGLDLPSWISTVKKLTKLVLHRCSSIQQLPQLGHLPHLSFLYISGATAVTKIGTEFFGLDAWPPFPKLNTLVMEDMINWEDWQWQLEDGEALPCLRELQLVNCYKLPSLPDGLRHATALTVLAMDGANRLMKIENLSTIRKLSVSSSFNLVEISNLSSLENLKVSNCSSLKKFEHLVHLQQLNVIDESMNNLPEGLGEYATKDLRWLELECNEDMFKSCHHGGSEWHKFQHIQDVHIHSKDRYMYFSYGKSLQYCEEATGSESNLAIVPVVSNTPLTNTSPVAIPNTDMVTNQGHFCFSPQKLLLILYIYLTIYILFESFFLSPTHLSYLGSSLISFLIDVIFFLISLPLCIMRDTFGSLSSVVSAAYKLFDMLVNVANYMDASIGAVVEPGVDFLFSSFSFSSIVVLSWLIASYGGWFHQ
ncbi:putative disease resistance protein RGA3 [Zingiber officinale]|uniref:putative disease resistance protein RGA3 n=1 Tax=Zingiber officinale TaxID=94328 RepID=UPI001C4A99AB|nr:putative disease resistance protein RGA3 [Zingiber officinale]